MEQSQFKPIIFLFFLSFLFSSCASKYNLIEPDKNKYFSESEHEGIQLEYKYDVLTQKYEKKAARKGIQVLAVKLSNHTEQDLKFGTDILLYDENGKEIVIMENRALYKSLKQGVGPYVIYLLLTPIRFNRFDERGRIINTVPIGLALGPGIAGLNMGKAITANEKFEKELLDFDVYGSIIKAGESRYGLIGIRSKTLEELKVQVN